MVHWTQLQWKGNKYCFLLELGAVSDKKLISQFDLMLNILRDSWTCITWRCSAIVFLFSIEICWVLTNSLRTLNNSSVKSETLNNIIHNRCNSTSMRKHPAISARSSHWSYYYYCCRYFFLIADGYSDIQGHSKILLSTSSRNILADWLMGLRISKTI